MSSRTSSAGNRTDAAGLCGAQRAVAACEALTEEADAGSHDVVQRRAAVHRRLNIAAEGFTVHVCSNKRSTEDTVRTLLGL